MNKHIGNNFNNFLAEEGLCEEVTVATLKRVIVRQISQAMNAQRISKTEMASRMHTSRNVVNRLLNQDDTGVALATLARVCVAI